RKLKEAHRQALDEDAMRALLGTMADEPVKEPSWLTAPAPNKRVTGKPTPEVPVCMFADWHLGEQVDPEEVNGVNQFNMAIAEARVGRLVDGITKLCTCYHVNNYPGIVIPLAGDFVSGGLHPELAKTDELESIPAALRARDLLVAALTRLADRFGSVYA